MDSSKDHHNLSPALFLVTMASDLIAKGIYRNLVAMASQRWPPTYSFKFQSRCFTDPNARCIDQNSRSDEPRVPTSNMPNSLNAIEALMCRVLVLQTGAHLRKSALWARPPNQKQRQMEGMIPRQVPIWQTS